ncbi:MAG: VOC family protein [Pseudomonadota bacterium]
MATATQAVSGARVGHGHLKVSDLERSLAFYRDVIGMNVMVKSGNQAAFLSFDDYHHDLGLNTWESAGGTPPPPGHTGLFHIAFLFPDRASLGAVIARVHAAGYQLTGASDHGVSEAVYLDDPDGNGLELYRDRPREEWPRDENGELILFNRRLDINALIDDATG